MNLVIKILFICTLIASCNYAKGQGFHFSNTRIDDSNNGTLNITSTMITADLEKALGVKSNNDNFNSKLKTYIKDKFSLVLNGKTVEISSIEIQTNNKSTRINAKVNELSNISSIIIKLDLLTEVDGQQNAVNIDFKNKKEQFSLDNTNREIHLNF